MACDPADGSVRSRRESPGARGSPCVADRECQRVRFHIGRGEEVLLRERLLRPAERLGGGTPGRDDERREHQRLALLRSVDATSEREDRDPEHERDVFQKRHTSHGGSSCSRGTILTMLGTVETLVIVVAVYAVVFLAHHAEGALARSTER